MNFLPQPLPSFQDQQRDATTDPDSAFTKTNLTDVSRDDDEGVFLSRPPQLTQQSHEMPGVFFDFNFGCRIKLPAGDWQVKLRDAKSDFIFGNEHMIVADDIVSSRFKYFILYAFEIYKDGELVMDYKMDLSDQSVLIQIPGGGLGDTLAWFPAVTRFQAEHGCKVTCRLPTRFHALFSDSYPDIRFLAPEDFDECIYYASYLMHPGLGQEAEFYNPVDVRRTPLHHLGSHLLGLPPEDKPARVLIPDTSRPIDEPYVCIGVQSTAMCKMWNNPYGWLEVVRALKEQGYRVICIDLHAVTGKDMSWHCIPHGAEDETGPQPLSERFRWLMHAEFFIGLSSGLSWLAWTAGIPVVLISGFSGPETEFPTTYRVINRYVCNSCWNDSRYEFDATDYFWCPRHQGTEKQFICSRTISAAQVLAMVNKIPANVIKE